MLSITRRTDESILLHTSDGTVEISIVQIKTNQVRLGIDASRSILIERSEVKLFPETPRYKRFRWHLLRHLWS